MSFRLHGGASDPGDHKHLQEEEKGELESETSHRRGKSSVTKGAAEEEVTPGPSGTGYQKTGDSECEERDYDVALQRAEEQFVVKVSSRVIDHLVKELPNEGVLTHSEVDFIKLPRNKRIRASRLIYKVTRKGSEASRRMLTHLWHIDDDLLYKLHLPSDVRQSITKVKVTRSEVSPEAEWRPMDPVVSCVEETSVYSLQSEAGRFECRISGLRWTCGEKVSFKYQFVNWNEHMYRVGVVGYSPGGPLLDVTTIQGELDEVYLPHWIYTGDKPSIQSKVAVLHTEAGGDGVYPVCEVTPSHVNLPQTLLSQRAEGRKFGLITETSFSLLIFETNKYFRPDVADRLKKLSPEDFVKFCRLVRDQVKGFPDEAEAGPVADFLVSTNNIQVAANALRNIGRLEGASIPDVALWRAKSQFVDNVSSRVIDHLLEELSIEGVLTHSEVDSIRRSRNKRTRARCLINMVTRKGSKASRRMLTHLWHIDGDLLHELDLPSDVIQTIEEVKVTRSEVSPEAEWRPMDPVVSCVEETSVYSLQSEAGRFECRISGLRWTCKESVSFRYQFGNWDEHKLKMEVMGYTPGGPLLDVTTIQGELDGVYLPHWIYTGDDPTVLDKFAVLHIKPDGDVVEEASEVTPSHVKLSETAFSPIGPLVRLQQLIWPRINCKVLVFRTDKAFLTLHVYLIPSDAALEEKLKAEASSSAHRLIKIPPPTKPLRLGDHFNLSASLPSAHIQPREPETYELQHESDPNFFEVYLKDCDQDFDLTIQNESGSVWSRSVRQGDYGNTQPKYEHSEKTGDPIKYHEKLKGVRRNFVEKVNEEIINQLVDDLLTDGVLNDGEKEKIQGGDTSADKARKLIDMVKRKGDDASKKMISHLESRDPTLHRELSLPPGPSA